VVGLLASADKPTEDAGAKPNLYRRASRRLRRAAG
jgi:hypothetical protein